MHVLGTHTETHAYMHSPMRLHAQVRIRCIGEQLCLRTSKEETTGEKITWISEVWPCREVLARSASYGRRGSDKIMRNSRASRRTPTLGCHNSPIKNTKAGSWPSPRSPSRKWNSWYRRQCLLPEIVEMRNNCFPDYSCCSSSLCTAQGREHRNSVQDKGKQTLFRELQRRGRENTRMLWSYRETKVRADSFETWLQGWIFGKKALREMNVFFNFSWINDGKYASGTMLKVAGSLGASHLPTWKANKLLAAPRPSRGLLPNSSIHSRC